MKLNFRNLNDSDKRVKLTPNTDYVPVGPATAVNPTLGVNDDGTVTFCLSKPLISCDGAIPNSGLVDLEGEFDVLVDGVIVASGVTAEDLATKVGSEHGIVFEPFKTTFNLPVYNPMESLPNVTPPQLTDPYNRGYFRIEHPNGATEDVGFTLFGQIVPDGIDPSTGEIGIEKSFTFTTPKDIPKERVDGDGPWLEEWQDLYILSSPIQASDNSQDIFVELYAYKNIQTNRYGWMVMVWDNGPSVVSSTTYFHIDEMGENFTLPVIDAGGEMVATNDNLDNPQNVAIASKNVNGMQEGTVPPPPPPPPELIPPPDVLDWITLSNFGYHNLFINDEPVTVKRSNYGYAPSRNDANVNNMFYSLLTSAGIEGFAVLDSSSNSMSNVILMNTRDEPVHVKLTRSTWDTMYYVAESPDNQNDSFNRDDVDTVHFWLGPKSIENFEPLPVTGTYNDNYFALKGFTSADGDPSLKDFFIAYLDEEEVFRGYPPRTKPMPRTELVNDPMHRELLDYYIDATKKIGRVPYWAYGEPQSDANAPTIFENLIDGPANLRFYFPLGVPAYFQASQNTSIEISERSVLIHFTPRKLVVDIGSSTDPRDHYSINLRQEFRRKYQYWMRDDLEVEFNLRRNLTPKIQPLYSYGENFAFEPVCIHPDDPLRLKIVSNKVSSVFVGRVPPISEDRDDYGMESDWTRVRLPYEIIEDSWGNNCTVNLNVYSTIYGLGGSGGFRRRHDDPMHYVFDGGNGFAPVTNFDNGVQLFIRVKSTGKMISGGGGGPSQPIGIMTHYSRRRQLLPDGSGGSTWGPWTSWEAGATEVLPNNGGGGGLPNGLDGAYRYSSTGPLLPIPGIWWMPYISLATNTSNGLPPFFGYPYEYKRLPAFNIRAKGAGAGMNWSSTASAADPIWHIPEGELYNATDWGTWSTWAKAEMTAEIPLGPDGRPSLDGGLAGPLVTGPCEKVTVESGGYIMADLTNSPDIEYE